MSKQEHGHRVGDRNSLVVVIGRETVLRIVELDDVARSYHARIQQNREIAVLHGVCHYACSARSTHVLARPEVIGEEEQFIALDGAANSAAELGE